MSQSAALATPTARPGRTRLTPRRLGVRAARLLNLLLKFCLCAFLSVWTYFALVYTITFPKDWIEKPAIQNPPLFVALAGPVLLPLLVLGVNAVWPVSHLRTRRLLKWGLPFVALGTVTWTLMTAAPARHDQLACLEAARALIPGPDKHGLEPNGYVQVYPHQIGLVTYFEAIARVVGKHSLETAVELLNSLYAVGSIPVLVSIAGRAFHSRGVANVTALLAFGCLPPLLMSSMDYGNVPGCFFSLVAIRGVIVFLQNHRWSTLPVAGGALGIAVALRSNSSIALVALVIVLVIAAVRRRWWQRLAAATLLSALALAPAQVAALQYEHRTHTAIDRGMPSIAWVTMGTQAGPMAPGWYNGYTLDTWSNLGGNPTEVAKQARHDLKNRLREFAASPAKAGDFYARKFITQWADPTFQSVWISSWTPQPENSSAITKGIMTGNLRDPFLSLMDLYQSGLLVLACVGAWWRSRRWTEVQVALPLFVLGGAAFHLLWEAKALYGTPYYLATVPLAAYGAHRLIRWLERWRRARPPQQRHAETSAASQQPSETRSAPPRNGGPEQAPGSAPRGVDLPSAGPSPLTQRDAAEPAGTHDAAEVGAR